MSAIRFPRAALAAARAVRSEPLLAQGLAGPALGEALRAARCRAVAAACRLD